jgi:benzoate/toluate 1,2-dioxygenase beta subunit
LSNTDIGKTRCGARSPPTGTHEEGAMTLSYEALQAFLYREARLLDDKEWDAWLSLYRADAQFWMPAWDDDGSLVTDPDREISLIYYANRGGLEDRVFRIKTERSSATSHPEARTSHNLSNIEILDQDTGTCRVRFNWVTFSFRHKVNDAYFGSSFYTLDLAGESPLIAKKKVVLKNDYIHHVIDIYHI